MACWGGTNEFFELDIPDDFKSEVKGVAVADEHVCAYKHALNVIPQFAQSQTTSDVYCHGNCHPQLLKQPNLIPAEIDTSIEDGDDRSDRSDSTDSQSEVAGAQSEAAGAYRPSPKVRCWGNNSLGQTDVPDKVSGRDLNLLTAGDAHTCTILNN